MQGVRVIDALDIMSNFIAVLFISNYELISIGVECGVIKEAFDL